MMPTCKSKNEVIYREKPCNERKQKVRERKEHEKKQAQRGFQQRREGKQKCKTREKKTEVDTNKTSRGNKSLQAGIDSASICGRNKFHKPGKILSLDG